MKPLGSPSCGSRSLTLTTAQPARAPLDLVLHDRRQPQRDPSRLLQDRSRRSCPTPRRPLRLRSTRRIACGSARLARRSRSLRTCSAGALRSSRAASGFAGAEGGPSPVWDALNAAAVALDDAAGRRGVIVVTDGRSTANRMRSPRSSRSSNGPAARVRRRAGPEATAHTRSGRSPACARRADRRQVLPGETRWRSRRDQARGRGVADRVNARPC